MVAEQVAEVAEPVQPEVPEAVGPNGSPEPEVVEQQPEVEDNFEDVLELLNTPEEGESAGTTPQTKEPVAAAKPKSEEEIRQEVAADLEARRTAEETQRNRGRVIEGMRTSYRQMDSDIETILADATLTEGERERKVKNRLAQHNGHWNELYQNDVQQAHLTGVEAVRNGVVQATATHLGKTEAEEVMKANHQTWESYLEDYGERWAKKKGYLPPTEAQKKFSDGQRDTLAKLKKLGIELPRGGEAKAIGSARSGPRGSANFRTKQEARVLHNNGRQIPSWRMKEIEADPNIPES